jgi:hypothetical protein
MVGYLDNLPPLSYSPSLEGNEPPLTPPKEGNEHSANTNELQIIRDQFPSSGGVRGGLSNGGVRGGLSNEANQVLSEGKKLWQAYFANTDVHTVRDELKLNRPDVGWYQVRKALQARNASGDFAPINFKPFEEAYKTLTEKLQPMVYELGFLKV